MTVFKIGSTEIVETKRNGVVRYTLDDIRIYRIRVESMPGFMTNVYLIMDTEACLIDIGSHAEKAKADLEEGFKNIRTYFNEDVELGDITNIVITHGHGDHFGMLAHEDMRGKKIYVHPADGLLMQDYAASYPLWIQKMEEFAREAGGSFVADEKSMWTPDQLPSTIWAYYDFIDVGDGDEILNGYQVYHTPGHSPGHICIKVGPVLFVGDHVLSSTTPHQSPGSYLPGLGLEIYLASLRKVAGIGETFGLAGHERHIYPVEGRAREIEAFHHQRLGELVALCQEDKSLYQLTDEYYSRHTEFIGASSIEKLGNHDQVAALEEIKAHVEYLMEHNRMIVSGNDNGITMYRSIEDIAS